MVSVLIVTNHWTVPGHNWRCTLGMFFPNLFRRDGLDLLLFQLVLIWSKKKCLTIFFAVFSSVLYMARALLFFFLLVKTHYVPVRERGFADSVTAPKPSPLSSSDVLPLPSLVKLYLTQLTVSLLFFSLSSPHLSSAHMKSFCGLLTCVSVLGTNTCLCETPACCLFSLFLCVFF